jgi:hypothetical protein
MNRENHEAGSLSDATASSTGHCLHVALQRAAKGQGLPRVGVFRRWLTAAGLFCFFCLAAPGGAGQSSAGRAEATPLPVQAEEVHSAAGPGHIVHSKFGGQIFGFDIDQNGTEGLLAEAQTLPGGKVLAAVETFDQHTGKILKVVAKTQTKDDFITWGVFGNSVGMVEKEKVKGIFVDKRVYHVLNPLNSNQFTGDWTPPIDKDHIIEEASRSQGTPNAAFWAIDNGGNFIPVVFGSDVAANTFGPAVQVTDANFASVFPALAYNRKTNKAIVAAPTLGNPFVPPVLATINLKNGRFHRIPGVGTGTVNGIAVDSETNIVCTTTEIDFSVQFYNLTTGDKFSQFLPGATNQTQSGADVAVDAVNQLFLVAQPESSTKPGTSSIHVYDEHGVLIKSIDGFHFSNRFNVVPLHLALKPSNRTGFVDGPDDGVTEIQFFKY